MRTALAATATLILITATAVEATTRKRSLYNRLGGQPALTAVVDDFIGNVAADQRIGAFLAMTDIPRLKRLLAERICAGGPCTYTDRDMRSAHKGLRITNAHFNALVEDLNKSLIKFRVPERERRELIAILAPMRRDIVNR
jgi:hemoglobin